MSLCAFWDSETVTLTVDPVPFECIGFATNGAGPTVGRKPADDDLSPVGQGSGARVRSPSVSCQKAEIVGEAQRDREANAGASREGYAWVSATWPRPEFTPA